MSAATARIRAHNLLCIQGFVGKGYSPGFVANMTRVVDSLDEAARVAVLDAPDVLCAACPNLRDSGCALHGDGTERGIVQQDRGVLDRLDLRAGDELAWGEILARIAARVGPADLDSICGACPWLPLGHCRAGLARLRESRR